MTSKTLFAVLGGVVLTWAAVEFVARTLVALTLTAAALMIAVALNHGVAALMRRRIPRPWAIAAVVVAAAGVITGLAFTVIPPAVNQGKALVMGLPDIIRSARATRAFHVLDDRLHIAKSLLAFEQRLPQMLEETAAPILTLLGGVLSAVAAVVTVAVLAIFMLIFGGSLVHEMLRETLPERRPRYTAIVEKTYGSIGGYLMGLGLICFTNATLTTTFLAIVGVPFFLPLGIVSGLSSLVPYAGPAVIGATVTVIAMATGGFAIGLASAIYFVLYGQLEGQVLAPLVFRRTVHVNPLVVILSVVFFGELAGIIGAVLAVPTAAALQIVIREMLQSRRDRLHLAATPLNSPDQNLPPSAA
jgi:predicted PurR-regulated permease PerM